MGKVGREIIQGDPQGIIRELNKGAAAELHDAFRYKLLARLASGLHAAELAEWFERTSQDEWGHLGVLMERIISLGGKPFTSPAQAESMTYAPYKEPPENDADLRTMIEDSLEGERAAIRFYNNLFYMTKDIDPVTADLARDAMRDEISDEDDLERFLDGMSMDEQQQGSPLQTRQGAASYGGAAR